MSAVRIVHLGSLVRNVMMAHVGGPRLISKRYHQLRKMHWGTAYPIFTNMGVIGKFSVLNHSLPLTISKPFLTLSSHRSCLEWP